MKKLICLIILFAGLTFAQTADKGSITLNLEGNQLRPGKTFTAPFTSVSLRRDSRFIINARAEKNNESSQLVINIELENIRSLENDKLELKTLSLESRSGDDGVRFLMMQDEKNIIGQFETEKGKALGIRYATQKIICKFTDSSIKLLSNDNKHWSIKGKLIIMLLSDGSTGTQVFAEIKEGSFEIII